MSVARSTPLDSGSPASTRYLLFFRAILLGNLLLAALYAPETGRVLRWVAAGFPAYAAAAFGLYWAERRGLLRPAAARASFLLDLGFAASAGAALPADSMGLFLGFFLVVLSSTLLRKPSLSFLVAAAACAAFGALTLPQADGGGDPGRVMKLALLAAIASFSVFMAAYARQIERGTAEPYELRIAWLERLSLAGRGLRGVLHEVRTPLGTILLTVENIRDRLRRGGSAEEELGVITREAERASEILEHFLEFTRPAELALAPLPLAAPMEKVVSAMRPRLEERGIVLKRGPDPGLRVLGSERHLVQAFTNLFMNAIQAMPSGGTLTVTLEEAGGAAVVRVSDTGRGLAPEELDGLLDPPDGGRPDGKGFGLGLGIARWIIGKHRGELSVESPGPGQGASAVVRLPVLKI